MENRRASFFQFRGMLGNRGGFTLLETIIAMAIMVLAFTAILSVESNSITASARSHQMNIVAMLARNKMVEVEYLYEGKTFEEFAKEKGENFKPPYEDYRWTYAVKEIKFPNLIGAGGGKKESGGDASSSDMTDMIGKLLTNFLSKAVREVTVTIFWKKGAGEQNFSVSTYWVDLNHEFALSE